MAEIELMQLMQLMQCCPEASWLTPSSIDTGSEHGRRVRARTHVRRRHTESSMSLPH